MRSNVLDMFKPDPGKSRDEREQQLRELRTPAGFDVIHALLRQAKQIPLGQDYQMHIGMSAEAMIQEILDIEYSKK